LAALAQSHCPRTAAAAAGSLQAATLASAPARSRTSANRRRTNDPVVKPVPPGRSGTRATANARSARHVRSAIP